MSYMSDWTSFSTAVSKSRSYGRMDDLDEKSGLMNNNIDKINDSTGRSVDDYISNGFVYGPIQSSSNFSHSSCHYYQRQRSDDEESNGVSPSKSLEKVSSISDADSYHKSLLNGQSHNDDLNSQINPWKPTLAIAAITFTLIALIGMVSWTTPISTQTQSPSTTIDEVLVPKTLIKVSNEYGEITYKKYPYPFLKRDLFAEVYKKNTLTFASNLDLPNGVDQSDCQFSHIIESHGQTDSIIIQEGEFLSGETFFQPTLSGKYSLSISAVCTTTSWTFPTMTIYSKYVRRNILELTEEDKEIFLNAYITLWKVSTSDGKKLYGDGYRSMNYFTMVHNDGSTSGVYDQFHGDIGFFPNHMWLSAYVEQSLQAVDPRTCLPVYFYPNDFASESFLSHISNQLDGGRWTRLLSDEFFGNNDPITGRITNSRWVNATLPRLTSEFFQSEDIPTDQTFFPEEDEKWYQHFNISHIYSPYGILRTPMCYNPSTYLTRYHNLNLLNDPSLESYFQKSYAVYPSDYLAVYQENLGTTMKDVLDSLYSSVHGNIHLAFGGTGGPKIKEVYDYLREKHDVSDLELLELNFPLTSFLEAYTPVPGALNTEALYIQCDNTPWIDGQLMETSEEDGPRCYCNPIHTSTSIGLASITHKIMGNIASSDDSPLSHLHGMIDSLDLPSQAHVLNKLCGSSVYVGDFYSKSSAPDPLFWVFHSNLDRLFQKIIFDDELTSYEYDTSSTISGHSINGTAMWMEGYKVIDESLDLGQIANAERFKFLIPTFDEYRDNMKYIYDHSDWEDFFQIEPAFTISS